MFYATLKYFQVRKKVVDIETVEIYCYWIMGWKAFAVSVFIISISNTNTSFAISPEFNPWLQKNGIYLDHLEDLSTSTALNSIYKMIVTKRLLFLGEPDHYITEKLQYQYQLIKRYVSKGYHTLAIEMGRSDARRINKYLMTGDEEILKSVALFGNLSEVITQRDLPKGLLGTTQSDEIKKGKLQWIEGNKDFWRKIRLLNSTRTATQPPLQVYGFDVDVLVGGAYFDIQELIRNSESTALHKIKDLLQRTPNESREQEIKRLESAIEVVESAKAPILSILGEDTTNDILASLRQLMESLKFISIAYEQPSPDQWMMAAEQREKTMMWQMDDYIRKNLRIIMLGHNDHLSQNSKATNLLSASSGNFYGTWYKIGTYLAKKYVDQVYGIWMLYGGGSRGPGPECPQMECSIDLNNESLNAKFLKASPDKPVLVPMLGGLPLELKTPHDFQFNGVNINSTIFAEQANGVLFVPKVTPTKPF
jgi:hypothetical protein